MVDNIGYILFGIAIGIILMYLVMRSERAAEFTSKLGSFKLGAPDTVGPAQLNAAFERFTDVAQGVVAIVDSGPADADAAARKWFDFLAGCLSGALRTHPDETYRVAIWEDNGHPDRFDGIGWAMFDANDEAVEHLSKGDTLAGIAYRSPEHEYYSHDVDTDRNYIPHSGRQKRYKSVFAIALGAPTPWGVMTIDAKKTNGFSETDLTIVRRFATLVSVGYAAREVAADSPDPETGPG